MNPDIIIIHGGNSYSSHALYIEATLRFTPRFKDGHQDWKTNLIFELDGCYNVFNPLLPCRDNAKFSEWKTVFDKVMTMVSSDVILIGHSLGANFLQQYLGQNILPKNISQLHFVSGCIGEGDFGEAQDWSLVTNQCPDIHVWHSEDDPVVPYSQALYYANKLKPCTLHTLQSKQHLNQKYFPELLAHLLPRDQIAADTI